MEDKSIESLLAELKSQRNACIGMDLEDLPEVEQRLALTKLESLEGELLTQLPGMSSKLKKRSP